MNAPAMGAMRCLYGLMASLALMLPLKAAEADGETGRLESYVDGLAAGQLRSEQVPGISLAIVKDGRVVLTKGYGRSFLQALPNCRTFVDGVERKDAVR